MLDNAVRSAFDTRIQELCLLVLRFLQRRSLCAGPSGNVAGHALALTKQEAVHVFGDEVLQPWVKQYLPLWGSFCAVGGKVVPKARIRGTDLGTKLRPSALTKVRLREHGCGYV